MSGSEISTTGCGGRQARIFESGNRNLELSCDWLWDGLAQSLECIDVGLDSVLDVDLDLVDGFAYSAAARQFGDSGPVAAFVRFGFVNEEVYVVMVVLISRSMNSSMVKSADLI
jgi:hypothetical protein